MRRRGVMRPGSSWVVVRSFCVMCLVAGRRFVGIVVVGRAVRVVVVISRTVVVVVSSSMGDSGSTGPSSIDRGEVGMISAGRAFVVLLFGSSLEVLFPRRRHFPGGSPRLQAAGAVKAGAIDHRIVNDRSVDVSVVNDRGVHVHYRSVVGKVSARPTPADKTYTRVAVAIVNPTIKADAWAPIPTVPAIDAACKTPVAGRPEKSGLRRRYPDARHPVVADGAIGPVTRSPQIALGGTNRLCINGHDWWSDRYGNEDAGERSSGCQGDQKCQK